VYYDSHNILQTALKPILILYYAATLIKNKLNITLATKRFRLSALKTLAELRDPACDIDSFKQFFKTILFS